MFVHTAFKTLIGPEGPERSVLRYWYALPLHRQLPDHKGPKAVYYLPLHVTCTVPIIKALFERQIITSSDVASRRKIYASLTADLCEPGRVEIRRPHLNWGRI